MCSKDIDYFEHPRYKINKILLSLVGQWPLQNKSRRRFFLSVVLLFIGSMIAAQVRKVIIEGCSTAILLEALPPVFVELTCASNLANNVLNSDKLYRLLKRVEADFHVPMGAEVKVLEQYANDGRFMTIVYTCNIESPLNLPAMVWLYVSMVIYMAMPFLSKNIVAYGIANISAPAKFPFPVDYYVDSEENYVYLQLHICTAISLAITVIISSDTLFVILILHASGIFAAVSYRLEHLVESEDLEVDLHPERADDKEFWIISDCIKKHNEAIQFAELLDAAYSWSFFVKVGTNVAGLSLTAVQLVGNMEAIEEAVRQAMLLVANVLHLFFECFFSQKLTDHSLHVFEALRKTKWYKTSIRSRRLLNLMIMRSMKPFELKAGKVLAMSMENFSSLMRTSMSYFTILCSVQ